MSYSNFVPIRHQKCRDLENRVRGSFKVIDNVTIRESTYWCSIVTVALSRVVSEIFNVEKYRDLEIPVRGHSESSEVRNRYGLIRSLWLPINVPWQPWAYLMVPFDDVLTMGLLIFYFFFIFVCWFVLRLISPAVCCLFIICLSLSVVFRLCKTVSVKMVGQLDKRMLHWHPATLYFQLFIIVCYLANKVLLL